MEKPGVPRRLTEAGIKQRRMAGIKHGRRAEAVTDADVVRYRLEKIDPGAPELIARYSRAVGGDLSELDALVAAGMASKEIIRRKMVEEIGARGVIIEEAFVSEDGRVLGRKVRANPVLDHLRHMDEHLGLTADQARLSRKSSGQGAVDAALASRLARDDMIRKRNADYVARTGDLSLGLPPPDVDILRVSPPDPEILIEDRRK